MKTRILFPIGAFVMLAPAFLHAEPVATAPAIPRPASNSHWTITYSNQGEPAQRDPVGTASPQVRSAEYEVTAPTARLTERYDGGRSSVVYVQDHFQLIYDRDLKAVVTLNWDKLAPELRQDRFTEAYPGFEWVSPQTFVGLQNVGKEPCAYFRKSEPLYEAKPDGSTGKRIGEIVYEAWASAKSGEPVAFRNRGRTGRYQFLAAPTSPITLPPEFAEAVARQSKRSVPPGQAASLR